MSDELRKAAQELLTEYDAQRFVSIFHTQIEALRAALATYPDCGKPTPPDSVHTCSPQVVPDVPYPGMQEAFESHFGQSWTDRDWRNEASTWAAAWKAALANAAPDSSLAPIIESLIGKYWDIAYEEGKTGISQGDLANQVLGRIRNALIAWAQRAAPDYRTDESGCRKACA